MSDDRMFERESRAWLELGPTQAPARAVHNALQVIATTPQQRALRFPWRLPQMTSRTRFVLAGAVGVVVIVAAGALFVGRPQLLVGTPSPTPSTAPSPRASPISLVGLRSLWASVGTRPDAPPRQPFDQGMTIDQAGLRISTFKGEVTSTASISADQGTLLLQINTPQAELDSNHWDCRTGDSGTYELTVSPDNQTLTLTSTADQCSLRNAILAGSWTRWSCPANYEYAYCNHVSELIPGRYVSPHFKPFGAGSSFAYTVPAGWAKLSQPPTWTDPQDSSGSDMHLTRLAAPDETAIAVYSGLELYLAAAVRNPTPSSCGSGHSAANATPAEMADLLESQPYLKVSGRTPVSIGGLSGVQIDVALVGNFFDPCSSGQTPPGPIEYSTEIEIFGNNSDGSGLLYLSPNGGGFASFILLGDSTQSLVIEVQAADQAKLDALIAEAMPVISSFEFIR